MSDRCGATNGSLRCVLRPHPLGEHVALVPEGDPAARVETWARADGDGPTLDSWRDDHRSLVLLAREERLAEERAASEAAGKQAALPDAVTASTEDAKQMGFIGDPCSSCGSMYVVRAGTCGTCRACGSTTGCG